MREFFNNPRIITDKEVEKKEREKAASATFGSGVLVGLDGKPIYDEELKQRARDMYAEFVNTHQREIQDWFNEFGQDAPVPIWFNPETKQVEWNDKEERLMRARREAGFI